LASVAATRTAVSGVGHLDLAPLAGADEGVPQGDGLGQPEERPLLLDLIGVIGREVLVLDQP
jgi:hypothetical protein